MLGEGGRSVDCGRRGDVRGKGKDEGLTAGVVICTGVLLIRANLCADMNADFFAAGIFGVRDFLLGKTIERKWRNWRERGLTNCISK